jgi:citrate lyase beta subunit
MRHFDHLDAGERERLFFAEPQPFTLDSDPVLLAVALGATLYLPGTRPALARDLERRGRGGVMSAVVCLEDSVADHDVPAAELNTIAQLRVLALAGAAGPLVFVRVRNPEQITLIVDGLGEHAGVLAGFVLPKFTETSGGAHLEARSDPSPAARPPSSATPGTEPPPGADTETRTTALRGIQELLDKHRDVVLAVRIGATDLSAAYGLRRGRDLTIYDVHLVADVIADVVNILGRTDGTGFVVTGPVWEYYGKDEPIFKPQLRESPFVVHDEGDLRSRLLETDLDGLIREVVLDKANGLLGKTVIHPTHVAAVHALSVVTHEEYADAMDVLSEESAGGGVRASGYRNKMNEARPHRTWAERTLQRAAVFGVAHQDVSFVDLLSASVSL